MECENVRAMIAAWLDGELTFEAAEALEQHITSCIFCRDTWEAYRGILTAVPGKQENAHSDRAASDELGAGLAQSVQMQILAEESMALRQELEQMRLELRGMRAEMASLRRQIGGRAEESKTGSDMLLPGMTAPSANTSLGFLL